MFIFVRVPASATDVTQRLHDPMDGRRIPAEAHMHLCITKNILVMKYNLRLFFKFRIQIGVFRRDESEKELCHVTAPVG